LARHLKQWNIGSAEIWFACTPLMTISTNVRKVVLFDTGIILRQCVVATSLVASHANAAASVVLAALRYVFKGLWGRFATSRTISAGLGCGLVSCILLWNSASPVGGRFE